MTWIGLEETTMLTYASCALGKPWTSTGERIGFANLEHAEATTPETVFDIASNVKQSDGPVQGHR
jgi:hypothetical protein